MTSHRGLEEKITGAAEQLFAQDGFAATGMRAIAQAAKVSIGAIYHHFKSKEAILERIIREELERRQQALEKFRAQGLSLQEQVQQIVQMHFDLLQEKSDVARLFFRERFDPTPVLKVKIQELYGEMAEYVAEIIRNGIASGEVRPCQPLLTAYAVLGMLEAVSLRALGRDETADLFMREGPKEMTNSLWFWLGFEQKEGGAHA